MDDYRVGLEGPPGEEDVDVATKPFQKETKIRFQDDEDNDNAEEPSVDSAEMAKAKPSAADGPQVDPIQKRMLEMSTTAGP